MIVDFLGTWQEIAEGYDSIPVGGLAYYIAPPRNFKDIIGDPIHALVYLTFVCVSCALFSRLWIEISGSSATNVAK